MAENSGPIGGSDGTHGDRESGLGLPADSRCVVESRPSRGTQYHRQHPEAARVGTGSGADSKDDLEGVLDPALGADCRGRLLHR